MLNNQNWDLISDKVEDGDFYRSDHRLIFRAIEKLAEKPIPFDAFAVSEALDAIGELGNCGGLSYLSMLENPIPGTKNIVAAANIVRYWSVLRQLMHFAVAISDFSFNTGYCDTADLLAHAEHLISNIVKQHHPKQAVLKAIKMVLAKSVDKIETLNELDSTMLGIGTGFNRIRQDHFGPATLSFNYTGWPAIYGY